MLPLDRSVLIRAQSPQKKMEDQITLIPLFALLWLVPGKRRGGGRRTRRPCRYERMEVTE